MRGKMTKHQQYAYRNHNVKGLFFMISTVSHDMSIVNGFNYAI